MTHRKLSILFSGMAAGDPGQGGATWAVLQYVLGLRRLGHEVCLVEPVKREKLRPAGAALGNTTSAAYFQAVAQGFGLERSSALLLAGTRETVGLPYDELRAFARRADVVFNVSGMLRDEALLAPARTRVYLDLDPAFVQLWHAAEGIDMGFGGHTHFVTVGQAIGRSDCPVPTCGVRWIPTFQPVVLDHWPACDPASPIEYDAFTTVGNFRGYGSVEYRGTHYGQKVHSLRALIALPTLTAQKFMPALAIDPAEAKDLAALAANGWQLLDPARCAGAPEQYQRFIQSSKAEIGIAKSGYVASRCGWFSDRSACYLASGRPVLAQETGFSRFLPTGEGLLSFETAEQAAEGADAIASDYPRHARAARALAEQYFDSDVVLRRLVAETGAAA
jgi:hypothetical protein